MSKTLSFNSPSLTTIYLRMMFQDTLLATGTGFIYELNNHYYLITNGHNVTGVNPETKKRLTEKHCGFPNKITCKVKTKVGVKGEDGGIQVGLHPEFATVPLYMDDECTSPLWLIHPDFGYTVDVIAIEIASKLEVPDHLVIVPINKIKLDSDIEPEIADDVFVLGYPYDVNGNAELPIWKRGSIATEPSHNIDRLPKILIDTATRPGMSGSPVLYQRTGLINRNSGVTIDNSTIIGTIRGLLGVYSGRLITKDALDAQLGIVWKSSVIEEIIQGNKRGTIEFQSFN